jgi:hypothetical protein
MVVVVVVVVFILVVVEENIWPEEGRGNREWRKLHTEELHDLYSSPTIACVIKSRRMRWEGRVAWRGEVCAGFLWGDLRERDHWGAPGIDGRLILRCIFRKWVVGVWTAFSWLRIEAGFGHL